MEPSLAIESQTQEEEEEDYNNLKFKLTPCNVIRHGLCLHHVNKKNKKTKHTFLTDTDLSPVDLIMFKSPLKYRGSVSYLSRSRWGRL